MFWSEGGSLDLEAVNEDGGDILDERRDEEADEASLGSPENPHDQRRWKQGSTGSHELYRNDQMGLHALDWEWRKAQERTRRNTEAMLRDHGSIRPAAQILQFTRFGVIESWRRL